MHAHLRYRGFDFLAQLEDVGHVLLNVNVRLYMYLCLVLSRVVARICALASSSSDQVIRLVELLAKATFQKIMLCLSLISRLRQRKLCHASQMQAVTRAADGVLESTRAGQMKPANAA